MKVIDLTTRTREPLRVVVDGSPAYDFLAALYVAESSVSERGFEADASWTKAARAALPRPVLTGLRRFFHRALGMGLVSLLDPPGSVESVPAFLARVEAAPADDLVRALVTWKLGPRPRRETLDRVLQSAGTAREEAIEAFLAQHADDDLASSRELLELYPEELKQDLLRLLRTFYQRVYRAEEDRLIPLLRADAEAKVRLAGLVAPTALVERATGGLVPDERGLGRVVLAPSYFTRPYNLIVEYDGVRVYVYPAVVEDPDERLRTLARVHKAFGDETRLRILRMLVDGDLITQEIANRLGVSHVTAIHHLALLRAARLIRVVERDGQKFNTLRPEGIAETEADLRAFLGLPGPRGAHDILRQPRAGAGDG